MTELRKQELKAGETLVISNGSYSDYTLMTLVQVVRPFVVQDLVEEFLVLNPIQRESYKFHPDEFSNFLITVKGLVKELKYRELYLGDYGDANGVKVWDDK